MPCAFTASTAGGQASARIISPEASRFTSIPEGPRSARNWSGLLASRSGLRRSSISEASVTGVFGTASSPAGQSPGWPGSKAISGATRQAGLAR